MRIAQRGTSPPTTPSPTPPRSAGIPVRLASGLDDPFQPGVRAMAAALGHATTDFSPGCHSGPFFLAQEPPSLAFLSDHLGA